MQVAIIGGTGFVGSHLTDALLENGHQVSLLVRKGSEHKVSRPDDCRIVAGELGHQKALDATLADCDAVIYSVGILREDPRAGITFEALQYQGVVKTIDAARRTGVDRFLLVSANGAKAPGTAYQETKHRAEEFLLSSGLTATILQPSIVFGDPRGRIEFATQLYRDMVAPFVPAVAFFSGANPRTGQPLMSPVHAGDVAEAVLAILGDAGTAGKRYPLGGPEVLAWSDMIRRIASAVGRRKWIVPMPVGFMRMVAALFDRFAWFPVTRDQLQMLVEGNTADPAIVESLTGHAPTRFDQEHLLYLSRGRTSVPR